MLIGVAAAGGAQAGTPSGHYAVTGLTICLSTASGCNDKQQPNDPTKGFVSNSEIHGVDFFDGAGGITAKETNVTVVSGQPIPNVSSSDSQRHGRYDLGADGRITARLVNAAGTVLTGPRADQTFVVDRVINTGRVSADGREITLGSDQPRLETITYSNGDSFQRLCNRSLVLVRIGP